MPGNSNNAKKKPKPAKAAQAHDKDVSDLLLSFESILLTFPYPSYLKHKISLLT